MFEKVIEDFLKQEAPINIKEWSLMITEITEYIQKNAQNRGFKLTYGRAKLITAEVLGRFENTELK